MNIRRLVLDVDKAIARPKIIEIASAIEAVQNVEGVNITSRTVALFSGIFVFFVARYAQLREELIRAERQLNLTSRGQFASAHLETRCVGKQSWPQSSPA